MAICPLILQVRLKMLYAGTRHSLKNELGAHLFIDEVHGTGRANLFLLLTRKKGKSSALKVSKSTNATQRVKRLSLPKSF
jgi:hypothetical protein